MIIIATALLGAIYGGIQAKRRGGARMDIAQYAVGYGMAFAIAGLFITVMLSRG